MSWRIEEEEGEEKDSVRNTEGNTMSESLYLIEFLEIFGAHSINIFDW